MNLKTFTKVAMIAAIYTVVSLVIAPIAFGPIQIRLSEALVMLPIIYFPAVWGVTIGCFITNLVGAFLALNPLGMLDALIGTFATLVAAFITYYLRNKTIKKVPLLSILAPVVFNFIFIGIELAYVFMPDNIAMGTIIFGAEVAVGEIVSVLVGYLLVVQLKKTKIFS